MSGVIYCNQNLNNRLNISGESLLPGEKSINRVNVKEKLTWFVENFVEEFENKLQIYDLIMKGKVQKAGKFADSLSETIGQGVGGALGVLIGIPLGFSKAGGNAGTKVGAFGGKKLGNLLGNKDHAKKIANLLELIALSQNNKLEFRKILVEAAFDIFQSFEAQFTRITAQKGAQNAMCKLAQDAVNRALNHWEHSDENTLAQCVLSGKSKRKGVASINPGREVHYCYQNDVKCWNTAKLYEGIGVVIEDSGVFAYYEKKTNESDASEYGYRRLLTVETWAKLATSYEHCSYVIAREFEDCQYSLDPKHLQEATEHLLDEINRKDKKLADARLIQLLDEVKNDVLAAVKPLESICTDSKDMVAILSAIEATLQSSELVEKLATNFHDAEEQRRTIGKSVEVGRDENRVAFYAITKTQASNHEVACAQREEISESLARIENHLQSKTPAKLCVWFGIVAPVKSFTGRDKELQLIHERLQGVHGQAVISQVVSVHGLGGIGKSELARKYAYAYRDVYDSNVMWINAETQDSLSKSFKELAEELKVFGGMKKRHNTCDVVKSVYTALREIKCLMIFDNAEEFEGIKHYLSPMLSPEYAKPYILITSRNRVWNAGADGSVDVVALDDFTVEEAVAFVKKELDATNKDVEELVEILQRFPLALQQAIAYIKGKNEELQLFGNATFEIRDYINEYKETNKSVLLAYTSLPHRYTKTVLTTWRITFEAIHNQNDYGASALDILKFMAYLAPDHIFLERFLTTVVPKQQLNYALKLLVKYSLINIQKGVASMHRLVQEVIRIELQELNEEETTLHKILQALSRDVNIWRDRGHIISVWNYASKHEALMKAFIAEKFSETTIPLLIESADVQTLKNIFTYIRGHTQLSLMQLINDSLAQCASRIPSDFKERLELVRGLIKATMADFAIPEVICSTPVHLAASCGHLSVVKHLLKDAKTGFLVRDPRGDTPLHLAALKGHLDIVKYLVDEKRAPPSIPSKDGRTPLHYAALCGSLDIVKYFVEEKLVSVSIKDAQDHTPLHCAAIYGYLDVIKYLVDEKGADFLARSNVGCTPMHTATFYGQLDVMQYLVEEKGADYSVKNSSGGTPLHWAANYGHLAAVQYLAGEKRAEYNVRTTSGATPLYCAAEFGHTPVVKYLVDVIGADLGVLDDMGNTPLHAAAAKNYLDVVKYIVGDKGMAVNAYNYNRNTPLHYAASAGHLDVVKYLVGEKGANVASQDNEGKMPLHYAAQNNHLEVLEYLMCRNMTVG